MTRKRMMVIEHSFNNSLIPEGENSRFFAFLPFFLVFLIIKARAFRYYFNVMEKAKTE